MPPHILPMAAQLSAGQWIPAPHLRLIAETLHDFFEDPAKNILVVNMPPRHGKSELISKYCAAAYALAHPERNIIISSYSQAYASRLGRELRGVFTANSGLAGRTLSRGRNSAAEFTFNECKGSVTAVGAGGAITGRGAHLFIIDDPVKNYADAKSPARREALWEWFRSTAYSRLEPGGKMVIVTTRWHRDDLVARLEKNRTGAMQMLVLPAIAEEGDPMNRKPGEALWPERYDTASLRQTEELLGTVMYAALYMQKPSLSESGLFAEEHFRSFRQDERYYYTGEGNSERRFGKGEISVFAAADLAVSEKDNADYTAITTFGVTPENDILVLDVMRTRLNPARHLGLLLEHNEKWHPLAYGIEKVQYQSSLIERAKAAGLVVKELIPKNDKYMRALGISLRMNNGKVFFAENAAWMRDFKSELLEFPNGRHDDMADTFAYADMMARYKGRPEIHSISRHSIADGFGT